MFYSLADFTQTQNVNFLRIEYILARARSAILLKCDESLESLGSLGSLGPLGSQGPHGSLGPLDLLKHFDH